MKALVNNLELSIRQHGFFLSIFFRFFFFSFKKTEDDQPFQDGI